MLKTFCKIIYAFLFLYVCSLHADDTISVPEDISSLKMKDLECAFVKVIGECRNIVKNYNDYSICKSKIEDTMILYKWLDKSMEYLCEREHIKQVPKSIDMAGEKLIDEFFHKFRDEILKEEGLKLENSCCIYSNVNFETARIITVRGNCNEEYRTLRFKISHKGGSFLGGDKILTNVILVLKNKDGFELCRKGIGDIKKYSPKTGEISIRNEDYKVLRTACLITDQDI